MEDTHLLLDYAIVPMVLWLVTMTIWFFNLKSNFKTIEKDVEHAKDDRIKIWNEMSKLETEIHSELKDLNNKIDNIIMAVNKNR